jgi:tetratricopeptide (TPR) repeat protein
MLNNQKLTSNQKAETWYYLGLTLDELSRTQEAIAAFDEALKLKPDYQAAAKRKIVGSSR